MAINSSFGSISRHSLREWRSGNRIFVTILIFFGLLIPDISGSWEEWWTYDGISGPGFWGLINPQWNMCNKGKRQSPINVEPEKLLFDPGLRDLQFDKHKEIYSHIFTYVGININDGPELFPYICRIRKSECV